MDDMYTFLGRVIEDKLIQAQIFEVLQNDQVIPRKCAILLVSNNIAD
jgi:hypothetical protein